jgi:hypothetical protein
MPACMITSIWPSAAIARTVMYGSTKDHDVLCSASGVMIFATRRSTPVAIHTDRKRAPTSASVSSEVMRRPACSAVPSLPTLAFTRSFEG